MPPRFEMLKQPPCISSSAILRVRAFSDSCASSTDSCTMFLRSASLITGTSRPRSVSTATPMFTYFLTMISLAARSIEALNCGKHLQRGRDDLHRDRRHCQVAAGGFHLLRVLLAQLLEPGDIREVALRDVRNGGPCGAQMLRSLAPHGAHRLALHRSKARKVRQRLGLRGAAARPAFHQPLRIRLHVLNRNPPAVARPDDLVDVDAELARHPAYRRRGRGRRQFRRRRCRRRRFGRPGASADIDDVLPAGGRVAIHGTGLGLRTDRRILYAGLVRCGRLIRGLDVGLDIGDFFLRWLRGRRRIRRGRSAVRLSAFAAAFAGAASADFADASFAPVGFAPAPSSTLRIAWPTLTLSPALTLTSFT